MISDQEKKAIEWLKKADWFSVRLYAPTILYLIEKQTKEIEKLKVNDLRKDELVANMSTRHFHDREKIRKYEELQDKIKSKIEELENEKEKYFEKQVIQHEIDVLQSLLNEEE